MRWSRPTLLLALAGALALAPSASAAPAPGRRPGDDPDDGELREGPRDPLRPGPLLVEPRTRRDRALHRRLRARLASAHHREAGPRARVDPGRQGSLRDRDPSGRTAAGDLPGHAHLHLRQRGAARGALQQRRRVVRGSGARPHLSPAAGPRGARLAGDGRDQGRLLPGARRRPRGRAARARGPASTSTAFTADGVDGLAELELKGADAPPDRRPRPAPAARTSRTSSAVIRGALGLAVASTAG